ncbi:hypothetical protein HPULCUR_008146 [Helicostylum pulchrum]|uniref:Major facilitator superfamily (MFS) profile domain-containing protein n=1 Tax=Helicostylum pulchrum TaxID=562976 RepID=A0ABP9Y8Q8_9FUNG
MTIFIVTSVGAAYVNNIWVLVVVRCLQSIGVSCGQSVGDGYISNLYAIEERGSAFGKYLFGVIFGPLLGPIIGGFLIMSELDNEKFDGQPPVFNTIECFNYTRDSMQTSRSKNELNPVISESVNTEQQSEKKKPENEQHSMSKKDVVDVAPKQEKMFNPFAPFALLRYPFILMSSVVAGLFFGAMFATETILPEAFSNTYGLNSWQVGLSYIGAGIGSLSGAYVGGRLSDRLLLRSRRLRGGKPKAEDRLTMNMWFAGVAFNPLGLLLFGWVVEYKLSFWWAIVGFGIQCFGNVQVVAIVTAYLVDSVPGRGAAVTAAANFVRFGISCILTLIYTPMIASLGAGWTSTLFAVLSWVGMLIAFILKIRGEKIRRWSGY